MATPPDFSVGGILTAAQMDQIGLWKVIPTSVTGGTVSANGTVTVGSAVSIVKIFGAFSSSFTNYRITVNGIVPSATDSFLFALGDGTATTGMFGSMYYDLFSGGTGTLRRNNAGNIYASLNESGTANAGFSMDVLQPQLSSQTQMFGNFWGRGYAGWFGGGAGSASFTGFALYPDSAGTFTGGTVSIYGYNPL